MSTDASTITSITLLMGAGRVPLDIMQKVHELALTHTLEIYLTTQQNLRLLNVPAQAKQVIMDELHALGASFKAPGVFPPPRTCVGKPHCNLGIIDTNELSRKILERFSGKKKSKPKLKIGISGCSLSCSGPRTSDIGIVAKKSGYDVYAGGRGGPNPVVGKRIGSALSEDEVFEALDKLVAFHDGKTKKIQRMNKLLSHPDFPY
jgi:sulfite reductase beta subunit-like hemoprotein